MTGLFNLNMDNITATRRDYPETGNATRNTNSILQCVMPLLYMLLVLAFYFDVNPFNFSELLPITVLCVLISVCISLAPYGMRKITAKRAGKVYAKRVSASYPVSCCIMFGNSDICAKATGDSGHYDWSRIVRRDKTDDPIFRLSRPIYLLKIKQA